MLTKSQFLFLILAQTLLIDCNNFKQDNNIKNSDSLNRYELVTNWPNLPDSFKLGNPTGIGIDTSQNIFIFHRAERVWPLINPMPDTHISSKTILMLDRKSGKILNSWGGNLFIMPHGLTVDRHNNIWVTDVGLHQVFKFSYDAKLLMKLGKAKIAGDDSAHFNRPTDVAVSNDGSFYVSDGYRNSRIIKFSSTGKYLFQWGTKGDKEGEFNIPHAIDVDEKGNVYVADRENRRVQVFDSTGNFLKQLTNKTFGSICSITFDKVNKGFIAVDDAASWFGLKHNGSNIILFDSTGNLLNQFGRSGLYDGSKCWYHDVAMDNEEKSLRWRYSWQ
ncbi:MAG: peptidyl-alpha-hydroxyglycine alpha-amidating lyase family protein [Segetibacter sp.]